MRVLTLGGAGFLGAATCAALAAAGHEPVVFDRNRRRDPGPWEVILGDVRDATDVTEAAAHAGGVIHLAGVLGTAETIANPRPAIETNIGGGLNVLEACAQYGVPLVNIGVGNHAEFSTYSITKATVERLAVMYARDRGLAVNTLRAFNAYGPGQAAPYPYGPSRVRKMIPSFICRALAGKPIQVYGDGTQVMDMIAVDDVARCLAAALDKTAAGITGRTWHAGAGRATTVAEIAAMTAAEVHAQTGTAARIEHLPMRPGETPGAQVLADLDAVRPLADPDLFTRLEDGLAVTVAWYRKTLGAA